MKRYLLFTGMVFAFLVILFLVAQALHIPLLTNPSPWLNRGGALAAALGVGLLTADVLLPVPSSLVMLAHGALFGTAVGTFLSVIGSIGGALAGFAIGRRGGPLMARLVPPDERARADRLLARWGVLAIVVTRPVPLLADTVAILSGASPLGWRRVALAAGAGALPPAFLFALAGATAATFHNAVVVFGLVLLMAGLVWFAGRWAEEHLVRSGRQQG